MSGSVNLSGCECGKPAPQPSGAHHNYLPEPSGVWDRLKGSMTMSSIDDQARQLARRVDTASTRAQFAAKKGAPVVLFSEAGAILGVALDPSKITQPDGKQTMAAFDSQGQLIGLIAAKDITSVAAGEPVGRSSRGVAAPIPQQIPQSGQMAAAKRMGLA